MDIKIKDFLRLSCRGTYNLHPEISVSSLWRLIQMCNLRNEPRSQKVILATFQQFVGQFASRDLAGEKARKRRKNARGRAFQVKGREENSLFYSFLSSPSLSLPFSSASVFPLGLFNSSHRGAFSGDPFPD